MFDPIRLSTALTVVPLVHLSNSPWAILSGLQISAKTGTGVKELFPTIIERLPW